MLSRDRRRTLKAFGLAAIGLGGLSALAATPAAAKTSLTLEGADDLTSLMKNMAAAPRRRDFKSVPMILDRDDQWDHEALAVLKAYKPNPRQIWDVTDIGGPWLSLIRNSLNAQNWSFKHPDFLAAVELHGPAAAALYDQAMWDKYQITKLAGDKFKTNTTIVEAAAASADPKNFEDPKGVFSSSDNSIPTLMRRGVVFMACHNAIWEQAGKLIELGVNPDKLSHDALAAELTNHLIEGVVLTPGAVATIPELQQVGFHYIR